MIKNARAYQYMNSFYIYQGNSNRCDNGVSTGTNANSLSADGIMFVIKTINADVAEQFWELLWSMNMIKIKGNKAAALLSRRHLTFD